MSKSRQKNPCFSHCNSGSMKSWKQMSNQRLRSRCKQKIKACKDWDSLIVPTLDEVANFYDSPKDGSLSWYSKPDDKECFRDNARGLRTHYRTGEIYNIYPLGEDGHCIEKRLCDCITNKNSSYWKTFRK